MDVRAAKEKHERELMRLPNVVMVGIGKKDDKDVIKVFVSRKVPESALQPKEIIPKTLNGFETDVEESGLLTAQNEV